jgi:hypothetical protein
MDRWDAAMGTSDAMWACIDDLARLGGFRGLESLPSDMLIHATATGKVAAASAQQLARSITAESS